MLREGQHGDRGVSINEVRKAELLEAGHALIMEIISDLSLSPKERLDTVGFELSGPLGRELRKALFG